MARVKACDGCGLANPPGELFCSGCGMSLAFVPETIPDAPSPQRDQTPLVEMLPIVRESAAPKVLLLFVWGAVEVRERLAIGRDRAFSPLADRLTPLDTVSRIHAEVFVEAGTAFVRHLSENNPTYVNGHALVVREVAPLTDGCELAFSRSVVATVRIG